MKNAKEFKQLQKLLDVKLSIDNVPFVVSKIVKVNIIKLDDAIVKKHGNYMDGKTSLKDFITKTYGKEANNLLLKLM